MEIEDLEKLSVEYALLKSLDHKKFEQLKRLEELNNLLVK
jgi:hypothetical protein